MLSWAVGAGRGQSADFLAAWIGYSDASGHWTWINGCQNNWTHWLPSDPNDYCGGEDCAVLTSANGGWMDISCRMRLPCICEYGGSVTSTFSLSVAAMRNDTCYVDCGDFTRWCSAWPFLRLYDVNDDVCHWEAKDGQKRGRGASQCADRVAARADCGEYFSYAVGECSCSPALGPQTECLHREPDVDSDVFKISNAGAQLVYPSQRCMHTLSVDDAFFSALKPASSLSEFASIWFRAAFIWLLFGVPSALAVAYVVWHMGVGLWCSQTPASDIDFSGRKVAVGMDSAYGPLIDAVDMDSGEAVNRWILRGAFCAIMYGWALLALGATLAGHIAGIIGLDFGFSLELIAALVMGISKYAVARAACMVHLRLAPVARQVAGIWIMVVAISKLVMSLTAFLGAVVFGSLANRDYENICFAEYLFRWSLVLALPLQCLAGVSLWFLMQRAARYAGGLAHMGGWPIVLILGNFASGAGVWWAGYLSVVHKLHFIVGAFFVAAALGQLMAGTALFMINRNVKEYFKQQTHHADIPAERIGQPISPRAL